MIITLKACLIPECGGADHRFEFVRPTLREVELIQQRTGLDFDAWLEGINAGLLGTGMGGAMIPAVLAMVDILHRRIGVRAAWDDIDIDLYNLDVDLEPGEIADQAEGEQDEQPAEAEAGDEAGKGPDPTSPSHPPEEPAEQPVPASGPDAEAASPVSSSSTQTASGSGSASP